LAFAPRVKFVKKCNSQAAAKTAVTVAVSTGKDRFNEKSESASESDVESSDDSATSSDDEQETGKQKKHETAGVADFKASVGKNDDESDDDELLLKKTARSDKLLEFQDSNKAVIKSAKPQVLPMMFLSLLHNIMTLTLVYNQFACSSWLPSFPQFSSCTVLAVLVTNDVGFYRMATHTHTHTGMPPVGIVCLMLQPQSSPFTSINNTQ